MREKKMPISSVKSLKTNLIHRRKKGENCRFVEHQKTGQK